MKNPNNFTRYSPLIQELFGFKLAFPLWSSTSLPYPSPFFLLFFSYFFPLYSKIRTSLCFFLSTSLAPSFFFLHNLSIFLEKILPRSSTSFFAFPMPLISKTFLLKIALPLFFFLFFQNPLLFPCKNSLKLPLGLFPKTLNMFPCFFLFHFFFFFFFSLNHPPYISLLPVLLSPNVGYCSLILKTPLPHVLN